MINTSKLSKQIQNGNLNSAHGSSAINLAQLPHTTVGHQKYGRNLRYTVPLVYFSLFVLYIQKTCARMFSHACLHDIYPYKLR